MPDVITPSLDEIEAELAAMKETLDTTEPTRRELLAIDRRVLEIGLLLEEYRV